MYSREIAGQEHVFGVSGKLWHGVLVMFDRETESLWTQLDGRSIQGELEGRHLQHVPSVFTSWGIWRDAHPDTLVLEKDGGGGQGASRYEGYFADSERLFLPHLGDGLDESIAPKDVVFAVRAEQSALIVTEQALEERRVINSSMGTQPVAVMRSFTSSEVVAVIRRVEGREVELELDEDFEPTERLRIRGGGTIAVSELPSLRVDRAYWYAWSRTVGARLDELTLVTE